MCGIAGFCTINQEYSKERSANILEKMLQPITHRGPDDSGIWVDDEQSKVAFGHRRLAIVDLSPEGHQPMLSNHQKYCVVFNGEIYNFKLLKSELSKEGYIFRGYSDTEVLLAAVDFWGIEEAVKRFVGMFAFALWDRDKNLLHLVRDRVGEKPLYYSWVNSSLVFASELKAITVFPDFKKKIDTNALALFLKHNYIPAPYCIYENVYKLTPGTILTLNIGNGHLGSPTTYWSMLEVIECNKNKIGSEEEVIQELDHLLKTAIQDQMVADVPVGAFLSGGVDSSTVVAIMQHLSSRPIKTFSIGFNEEQFNEAEHAKAVAAHLKTDHTELYVSPQQAMDVIPKLPFLYDEPFSDSSQIPTYLVSQLARKQVTVSLSGDGGDELFAGYNRYLWGESIWKKIGWVPRNIRGIGSKCITSISPQTWDSLFNKISGVLPGKYLQRQPGDKMHKIAKLLSFESPDFMYQSLISHWDPTVVNGSTVSPTFLTDNLKLKGDLIEWMMYADIMSYLPDDILVKVDRASMGVSLESRVPFLDHRLIEFAWRIPMSMKIQNNQGKAILRKVLYKYVPKELIERPKMGFGVPIDQWLRGPLKEWADDLLDPITLKNDGFFKVEPILQKWEEHKLGTRNWQYHLWDILMFQMWLKNVK